MNGLTRRAALAGAAASALPLYAKGGEAARLRDALDNLPISDPVAALRRLEAFDPRRLPLTLRIDLTTVRAGLRDDLAVTAARSPPMRFAALVSRRVGAVALPRLRARLENERLRLSSEADALLIVQDLTAGSVGARYRALFADPRWHYSDDETGRDRAILDMKHALSMRRAAVSMAFTGVPTWCLDVAAKRLSRAEELAGKGGYRVLPQPRKPGAYYVDLHDIGRRPRWSLPSVVAHELLPGHMLQLPMEAVAQPHALRLVYTAAFPEGWATWAEQLAAQQDAFVDPLDRLGHLHWLLFRVCRGLVDIAIHCDGWSLERAEAALRDWQGEPAYFAPFATDLARIAADPGARAAEALAWLAIADRAPRDLARLKVYHARLLDGGRKRITLP